MRRTTEEELGYYWEPGTIAVWRWLGLTRFFPENKTAPKEQRFAEVMRGCAAVRIERFQVKHVSN
jgi:hypothetical protein